MEYNAMAQKYFCDRFKWSKVDDMRLDDLVDNAHAYELELAEAEVRHSYAYVWHDSCVYVWHDSYFYVWHDSYVYV